MARDKTRFKICPVCGFQFVAAYGKEWCTKACYSTYLETTPKRQAYLKKRQAALRDKRLQQRIVLEDEW